MSTENTKDIQNRMREAVEYLDSTPLFASKSPPENIKKYLEAFGHPERGMKIIHVAGTNGKGSVCSQIASALSEAGFHVGLFISPHLTVIRERMSIDGEMISEEEFLDAFARVKEECLRQEREGGQHLLYFEMLFLMAMLWFSYYLGDTIGLIAGEKAGILRKGCPAVYLTEPEEAYQVIRQKALQVGAPVFEVSPQMWKVNRADDNGIDFSVDNRYDKTLRITFKGKALFQCENAALAATACGIVLREAGKYDPEVLVRGIERFAIPGRMEQILPGVWIDGAHNPDGIRAFLESAAGIVRAHAGQQEGGRRFLLFSCVKDKNYSQELHMISRAGIFTDIAAVPMEGKRALDAQTLRRFVSENASGIRVHDASSVEDAVKKYIFGKKEKDLVFAAGSLYLIGEMRGLIEAG